MDYSNVYKMQLIQLQTQCYRLPWIMNYELRHLHMQAVSAIASRSHLRKLRHKTTPLRQNRRLLSQRLRQTNKAYFIAYVYQFLC